MRMKRPTDPCRWNSLSWMIPLDALILKAVTELSPISLSCMTKPSDLVERLMTKASTEPAAFSACVYQKSMGRGLLKPRLSRLSIAGAGSRKVKRVQAWLSGAGQTLKGSYFYSDSHNDIPLLQLVDHPVAVDPDEPLRRLAERLHWPCISLR